MVAAHYLVTVAGILGDHELWSSIPFISPGERDSIVDNSGHIGRMLAPENTSIPVLGFLLTSM